MEKEKFDRDKPRVNLAFIGRKEDSASPKSTTIAALKALKVNVINFHSKPVDVQDGVKSASIEQIENDKEENDSSRMKHR